MKGASLSDPTALSNASLDGAKRREINLREGHVVGEAAFTALIREAVMANMVRMEAALLSDG